MWGPGAAQQAIVAAWGGSSTGSGSFVGQHSASLQFVGVPSSSGMYVAPSGMSGGMGMMGQAAPPSPLSRQSTAMNEGDPMMLAAEMLMVSGDVMYNQQMESTQQEITVVTDHDPVLPDVSLEIDLENEIVLDSTEALGTGTYGRCVAVDQVDQALPEC